MAKLAKRDQLAAKEKTLKTKAKRLEQEVEEQALLLATMTFRGSHL